MPSDSFHGDQNAAGDVTQQIFLKLMTSIVSFAVSRNLRPGYRGLVVNTCIDEQRKREHYLGLGRRMRCTNPANDTHRSDDTSGRN